MFEAYTVITAYCFSLGSGLSTLPSFGSLLNVPLVDDPTDQETNQVRYDHSLPSEDDNQGVCIGEVLPPIPKKLAEHIWQGNFIKMGELLPETWKFKPGDKANQ